MTKEEIADVLEQIATLLELKDENPFKVRAYTNAARLPRARARAGVHVRRYPNPVRITLPAQSKLQGSYLSH